MSLATFRTKTSFLIKKKEDCFALVERCSMSSTSTESGFQEQVEEEEILTAPTIEKLFYTYYVEDPEITQIYKKCMKQIEEAPSLISRLEGVTQKISDVQQTIDSVLSEKSAKIESLQSQIKQLQKQVGDLIKEREKEKQRIIDEHCLSSLEKEKLWVQKKLSTIQDVSSFFKRELTESLFEKCPHKERLMFYYRKMWY